MVTNIIYHDPVVTIQFVDVAHCVGAFPKANSGNIKKRKTYLSGYMA